VRRSIEGSGDSSSAPVGSSFVSSASAPVSKMAPLPALTCSIFCSSMSLMPTRYPHSASDSAEGQSDVARHRRSPGRVHSWRPNYDLRTHELTSEGRRSPSVLLDMRPLQGRARPVGVGAYARGLLKGLIKAGFDSNLTLLLDVDFRRSRPAVGQYRLAGCRRARSHGQLAAYEDAVALTNDIQRLAPDVYHAIDFHLPGRSPCPLVVTLHDLIPWAWGGPRIRASGFATACSGAFSRRADLVIAVSPGNGGRCRSPSRRPTVRIRIIREAADPVFTPKPGASGRVEGQVEGPPDATAFCRGARRPEGCTRLLDAWTAPASPTQT